MKKLILILILLLLATPAIAKHKHLEKYYQHQWNILYGGGIESKTLPDGSEVDILTPRYAVEVDFAPKWAESVGQSLYYADRTGMLPCVVLILEHPEKEQEELARLLVLARKYNITVWIYDGEWKMVADSWRLL